MTVFWTFQDEVKWKKQKECDILLQLLVTVIFYFIFKKSVDLINIIIINVYGERCNDRI